MRVSLIVAISENGVIGRDSDLPWRLSADLRRFKRLTMGHHIIMGRKTFESIGRLLPGRTSVVITRQPDYTVEGALVAHDFDGAMRLCGDDDEVFVIGGGQIYNLALPQTERLYVTRVHANVDGDTHFPEIDIKQWRLLEEERFDADDRNEHEHTFSVYERSPAPSIHRSIS